MLFIDFSFNIIVPLRLVAKLRDLGLSSSLCSWVLNCTSSTCTFNTGAPQGCVLSPLHYSTYTHDCTATTSTNTTVKFAEDTVPIGLISNKMEPAYLEEVELLTS